MPRRRPARPLLALALVAALLAAAPARAAVTLELASLTAEEDDGGWRLRAAVEGSADVESATVTPPGRPALELACERTDEGRECELESPPAATLAALLATYPSGPYGLALNGGTHTAALPFAPVAPNGLVTATSPADGAVDVDPAPSITWVHDCTSCNAIGFSIDDLAAPVNVLLERFLFGDPPPAGGTLPFAELESQNAPVAFLEDGLYELETAAAIGAVDSGELTPGGDEFVYTTGALRLVRSAFRVPEPGAAPSALAAAAALAALRRRGRRS